MFIIFIWPELHWWYSEYCDTVVLDWVKPQKVVLGSVIVHCNKKASVGQAEKATIEVIKTRARVPFASGDVSFAHWLVLESLEWPFWRLKYCLYIILIPNIDYKTGRFQRAPIQDKSKERNEYIVLEWWIYQGKCTWVLASTSRAAAAALPLARRRQWSEQEIWLVPRSPLLGQVFQYWHELLIYVGWHMILLVSFYISLLKGQNWGTWKSFR